jgi:hypothetical protein
MNKYILVFVVILLTKFGFTQSEKYTYFIALNPLIPFSPINCVRDHSLCGIQYSLINIEGESIRPYLFERCTNYFARDHLALLEQYSHYSIFFWKAFNCKLFSYWNNFPVYDQTNRLLNFRESTNLSGAFQSNSSVLSLYGINEGLSAREINSSQDLLRYEKPVFNASSLHKEKVIGDLMKQLKRNEYDFSGILQEIIRPSTLPFQ